MKTPLPCILAWIAALPVSAPFLAPAGVPGPNAQSHLGWSPRSTTNVTAPFASESGPDHTIWSHVHTWQDAKGRSYTRTNVAYVEIASGLNYQETSGGAWVPSREIIEPCPGGAMAVHGQHKLLFANNLNTDGAVTVQTDTLKFHFNPLGLAYID